MSSYIRTNQSAIRSIRASAYSGAQSISKRSGLGGRFGKQKALGENYDKESYNEKMYIKYQNKKVNKD